MMIDLLRKIFFVTLVGMYMLSCASDEGNYVYTDLNELEISGVSDAAVLTYAELTFSPSLGGMASGEDHYSFEWKAVDRNGENESFIIGESRELHYEVALPPGQYSLFFTVTEKATGLYWQKEVSLTVSSSMSEGWMVLCSDDGRARLDIASAVTGEIYRDVLASNGTPVYYGPRRIQWLSDKTDASSPYYLLTDDGATRLGKDDFGWKPEYDFQYEVASAERLVPYSIVSSGFGKVVVSGTKAYYCEVMGFDGLYGSAVNKDFPVSQYVGANISADQVYAAVYLLYDMSAKRFLALCPLLSSNDLGGLEPLMDMEEFSQVADGMAGAEGVVGTAFGSWPQGMDLLYMENTRYDPGNARMGMTYSILSDGKGVYLYGIQLGDILRYADCTYVLGKGYYGDLSGCRNISSVGNLFAFSSLNSRMYYSSGSVVYSVDLSSEPLQAREEFTLQGEEITCLKFNLYRNPDNVRKSYDLIVGSEKNGEGILRIYEGRDSGGDFRKVEPEVFGGFARIKDVEYKERVY